MPCRGQFRRKGSLFTHRFQPAWGVAIFLILVCSMWLGFFSYKHLEYSSELWWQFTLNGDAPRFLRATLGVSTFAYFPYCYFNFLNPILGLIYGFMGINVQRVSTEDQPPLESLPQAPLVDQGK